MSKLKVKIYYGVFSGERNGPRLRKALRRAGYEITAQEVEADIIIAHSAGAFWLPQAPTNQKLMIIDPVYWPSKSVKERIRAKAKTNLKFRHYGYPLRYWLAKNLWGAYYAVRDAARTQRIIRHAKHYDLEQIIKGHAVLLVRNIDDAWLTPNLDQLKAINPNIIIKEMPGEHDDWFYNPQPYVDLLKSIYGTGSSE